MSDPLALPPPLQGGGPTSDSSSTKARTNGPQTPDRPKRPLVVIPPENARYFKIACVNENESLYNMNPFIVKKVLNGQVGGELEYVRRLRDGSLLAKVQFKSQIKDLLRLTQIHDRTVKVTIPVAPNTCKGVIFQRDLRTMEESEILEAMNDQGVVEVNCMTKLVENVRQKTGLCFFYFCFKQDS